MNNYKIITIGLIAVGAIAGTTFATIAYRNSQESSPSPTPTTAIPSLSPTVASSTPAPVKSPLPSPPAASPTGAATPTGALPTVGATNPTGSLPTPKSTKPDDNITNQLKASEFPQFRTRLVDAIQRRDAKFIRAIATPQTQGNNGSILNLDSYNIDSSDSQFWQHLEKAVNIGCIIDSQAKVADKEVGSDVWICPDLTKIKQLVKADKTNYGNLAVLKQNVNVRSAPGNSGRVVDVVSQEYVAFDSATFNRLPQKQQEEIKQNAVSGWTPVQLSNGKQGWIFNRYIYNQDVDYRVSFFRHQGQWRWRYFLLGNGN